MSFKHFILSLIKENKPWKTFSVSELEFINVSLNTKLNYDRGAIKDLQF